MTDQILNAYNDRTRNGGVLHVETVRPGVELRVTVSGEGNLRVGLTGPASHGPCIVLAHSSTLAWGGKGRRAFLDAVLEPALEAMRARGLAMTDADWNELQ